MLTRIDRHGCVDQNSNRAIADFTRRWRGAVTHPLRQRFPRHRAYGFGVGVGVGVRPSSIASAFRSPSVLMASAFRSPASSKFSA